MMPSQNGALYKGLYYWVLEPAVLLMLTGLAFALLGFSLDRIFNPRLRGYVNEWPIRNYYVLKI